MTTWAGRSLVFRRTCSRDHAMKSLYCCSLVPCCLEMLPRFRASTHHDGTQTQGISLSRITGGV